MNETDELIAILRLDCILTNKSEIKFRIYASDHYQNDIVVKSTLEMFYSWSQYCYENTDIVKGGLLSPNSDIFEMKIQTPGE